ncbi:MAG: geranylgeranyl reductase family protein [Desulfobacterales bacterium]|nr:geranylgeranyl reductase family protein [Desulfobacterales bacterium]
MNKSTHCYDVIIIGAGPSGSTAAFILANRGFKVLVIDKHKFPRHKLCAGLLTWKTIKVLEDVFQTDLNFLKSQKIIQYQSLNYAIHNKKEELIKGEMDFPYHFVDRKIYDKFWLDKAGKAGAKVLTGEKVLSIDIKNSKVKTDKDNIFKAKFLLGADGVLSRTRNTLIKAGFIKNKWSACLATALEIFIPRQECPSFPDYPIIYFGYIPWGYAWSFPGADNQVLGICGLNRKVKGRFKECFYNFLKNQPVSESKDLNLKGHPLPYGNYLTKPGHNNILLLGDACGLADPLLGEGIYYAHKSGELAAKAVLESYNNRDSALKIYSQFLNKSLIIELKYAKIWRQIVFSIFSIFNYKPLPMFMRIHQRAFQEIIHGQRSFKWWNL